MIAIIFACQIKAAFSGRLRQRSAFCTLLVTDVILLINISLLVLRNLPVWRLYSRAICFPIVEFSLVHGNEIRRGRRMPASTQRYDQPSCGNFAEEYMRVACGFLRIEACTDNFRVAILWVKYPV